MKSQNGRWLVRRRISRGWVTRFIKFEFLYGVQDHGVQHHEVLV